MKIIILLLLGLLSQGLAFSQKKEDSKKVLLPPLSYNLYIGGDFRTGNVERNLLSSRLSLNYETKTSPHSINCNPKYIWGTLNNALKERELFADANYTFAPTNHPVYYLAFGIYETSNLRKINSRTLGGIGIGKKFTIGTFDEDYNPSKFGRRGFSTQDKPLKVSISNAILFEQTDFMSRSDISVIRNSTRIKLTAILKRNFLTFTTVTYVQPAVNTNNFRWNALSQLNMKLSKNIAFTVTVDNSYESVVPDGAKNQDIGMTFGFTFRN